MDIITLFEESITIKCEECKNPIYLTENEIKRICLYQRSDWTKCLCPSCTDKWKKENGAKEK